MGNSRIHILEFFRRGNLSMSNCARAGEALSIDFSKDNVQSTLKYKYAMSKKAILEPS